MSKKLILILFLGIWNPCGLMGQSYEFPEQFLDLGFAAQDAQALRQVISEVDFMGQAHYRSFVFVRSGDFGDHIHISKPNLTKENDSSFFSMKVSETSFLYFINYLEDQELMIRRQPSPSS